MPSPTGAFDDADFDYTAFETDILTPNADFIFIKPRIDRDFEVPP